MTLSFHATLTDTPATGFLSNYFGRTFVRTHTAIFSPSPCTCSSNLAVAHIAVAIQLPGLRLARNTGWPFPIGQPVFRLCQDLAAPGTEPQHQLHHPGSPVRPSGSINRSTPPRLTTLSTREIGRDPLPLTWLLLCYARIDRCSRQGHLSSQ
jgi:hypothetical protein